MNRLHIINVCYILKGMLKTASKLAILFVLMLTPFYPTLAQEEPSFAVAKTIDDPDAVAGDIISFNPEAGFKRSAVSFDRYLYGVIGQTATVIYYPIEEGVPIIRSGQTTVNVTTLTGEINPGDYITSSVIPGKGQKTLIREGTLLGVALTGLKEGEGTQITFEERQLSQGSIEVLLQIGSASEGSAGNVSRLVDQLGVNLLKNIDTPTGTSSFFRFLLATLVAVGAIAIGFGSFGRNVTRGIEAIGRNPLAKGQIQAMIFLNVFLIALISLAGIILALAIIRS